MNGSPPEIVDNRERYRHDQALQWLGGHRSGPLSVATGYVRIGGLLALAALPGPADRPIRLLLGAMPEPGLGAMPVGPQEPRRAGEAFDETLKRLRQERDFDAFPPSRRTGALDQVEALIRSDRVQVRRYTTRFLHGKAYVFAERGPDGALAGEGGVLVSSANLTSGGLEYNLELGIVHYQPNVVRMALDWFDELWAEAADFKQNLLDLLFPPGEVYTPQQIFNRALLELYGDQVEAEVGEDVRGGGVTLVRFQEDGYRRARRILEEFGGVIYADGVGTGKTKIGLRFIDEFAGRGFYTLVVTPAQLRDSLWRTETVKALLPCEVISYQELATDRQLNPDSQQRRLLLQKDSYRLVVIDEAHAFRNADNTWYAALDRLLGGSEKSLALLTATPVNNTLWDLYNLVMLFARHDAAFRSTRLAIPSLKELFVRAGANDPDRISDDVLFPLVDGVGVRRDRRFLEERYSGETFEDGTPVRFPTPVLAERRYDLDSVYPGVFKDVVEAIGALTMARYVPSRYEAASAGEVAQQTALAGLMQSQLLKRFESSVAAARATLDRMILAHETLVTAWRERGMVLSLTTLRDVVLEAQSGEPLSDLVEAALDEDQEARSIEGFDARFLEDVQADLERLQAIAQRLAKLAALPDPKLGLLAELLNETPASKVAVFTTFADTAEHVAAAIEADPDRFGGREMTRVIGTETDTAQRIRELERFAPQSVGDEPVEPESGEVDLLIATDIVSEGQNLQQAQGVISFDMPWNPQRVVQRNGRVIRLRSPHDEVYLHTMLPKRGDLEAALRLEARIRGKIAAANATFGMESEVLADVEATSKAFADEAEARAFDELETLAERIATGDASLLDEGQAPGSAAFTGEQYRWVLSRLFREGMFSTLRAVPWGSGSAFVKGGPAPERRGAFFACRTPPSEAFPDGERLWRFVSAAGDVVRQDLEMLRLIDPGSAGRAEVPADVDLERLWRVAAQDMCREYNAKLDPKLVEAALPASQRWALGILEDPDLPNDPAYVRADDALGVGRNQLVRRALADVRRRYSAGEISLRDAADAIVGVVDEAGLRPEPPPAPPPAPLRERDLGVVCFQVVL